MFSDPNGEVAIPAGVALASAEGGALASNPVGWVVAAGLGGTYVGTLIYDNFEPQISLATSWIFGDPSALPPNVLAAGNGGVGNSSGIGTNTPYKHCRDLKGRPGWIECKDKKAGNGFLNQHLQDGLLRRKFATQCTSLHQY